MHPAEPKRAPTPAPPVRDVAVIGRPAGTERR